MDRTHLDFDRSFRVAMETDEAQAGERHAIANDGDAPLETVNVYTPPR